MVPESPRESISLLNHRLPLCGERLRLAAQRLCATAIGTLFLRNRSSTEEDLAAERQDKTFAAERQTIKGGGHGESVPFLQQHEDGFLALRESVAGGREANTLNNEAALLQHSDGRPVIGGCSCNQRTFGNFPQQQV